MPEQFVQIPACHILIEIHGTINETSIHKATKTFEIIKAFSQSGFYFFNFEINGWLHETAEYSFLHESCLEKYGVATIFGKYLP